MRGGIPRQAEDVILKAILHVLRRGTLRPLHLDLPRVVDLLPTKLPSVEVSRNEMDLVFLLEVEAGAEKLTQDYPKQYNAAMKETAAGWGGIFSLFPFTEDTINDNLFPDRCLEMEVKENGETG